MLMLIIHPKMRAQLIAGGVDIVADGTVLDKDL